jgi:ribonuclease T2
VKFYYTLFKCLMALLLTPSICLAQLCTPPEIKQPTQPINVGPALRVPVDHQALVLSWSPNYCLGHGDKAQCRQGFGFVVHGLWPQSAKGVGPKGQPRQCATPTGIAADTLRQYWCLLPSTRLMQNEWQAHGTCGWPTPEAYFAQVARLHARYQWPGYAQLAPKGQRVTAQAIKQAFVTANPGKLTAENLAVFVDRSRRPGGKPGRLPANSLKEVMVCMDKKFNAMVCPPADRRLPDHTAVWVEPPAR